MDNSGGQSADDSFQNVYSSTGDSQVAGTVFTTISSRPSAILRNNYYLSFLKKWCEQWYVVNNIFFPEFFCCMIFKVTANDFPMTLNSWTGLLRENEKIISKHVFEPK
jgi:hypothetical protein